MFFRNNSDECLNRLSGILQNKLGNELKLDYAHEIACRELFKHAFARFPLLRRNSISYY